MKASEALKIGDTLRPAAYQERFCHVEGRGLCSDAWGAIIEAVKPYIADLNWSSLNVYAFERSMDVFRALQQQYFKDYFSMSATCPGAKQTIQQVGGRMVVRDRQSYLKTYDDYAKMIEVGGITSECHRVKHLAGMIDHLFYKHRWQRLQIAEILEWYENTQSQAVINRGFTHYAANWR